MSLPKGNEKEHFILKGWQQFKKERWRNSGRGWKPNKKMNFRINERTYLFWFLYMNS